MKTSKYSKVLRKHLSKLLSCRLCTVALLFICIYGAFLIYSYQYGTYHSVRDLELMNAPYKNPGNAIDIRISDLMSRMTLQEKIGQMALVEKNSIESIHDIPRYGIGALLSGGGGKPADNSLHGWQKMVKTFMESSRQSRLQIPILYGIDAIHGHANIPGATVFPHFIGLGASDSEDLVERIAQATAHEILASGIRWSFSPTLDMPSDIRWGRTYETFSDDPEIVGILGAAYLAGLQQESASGISVLGTLKHYVGVGSMQWGSSSNPLYHIDQGTTEPNEAMLRSQYLPPFEKVIESGALSIMVGLNSWGDTKVSASKYLITDVLKNELGFKGFVVSDWYGVYEIHDDTYEATVQALNAGVDLIMLPYDYKTFIRDVEKAVENGDVSEERINDAVERILYSKFRLGLFEDMGPVLENETLFGSETHRALAREAVARSLVLLKNSGVLPIPSGTRHIRVAGSSADNVGRQAGAWTVEWQGADGNFLPGATSILKGIEERVPEGTLLEYEKDGNFITKSIADIGIAIVGEAPYAEGWGDNPYPSLSPEDLEVISKLKANSSQIVVVIVSGRPLIITDQVASWDALIAAWLPGSEGAGVSSALFGDTPFTGSLPLPWPRTIDQLPFGIDGTGADGTAPLFPRYYGL